MTGFEAVATPNAPVPAGPYSQAIVAGPFIFLAGQTPRTPEGVRLLDSPVDVQARQTLDNLAAVAAAAGSSLDQAVKVTVYVRPGTDMTAINQVYSAYFSEPLPARTTIISDLTIGTLEIDAILWTAD